MIVASDCTRSEDRRVRIAENDALTGLDAVVVEISADHALATLTITLLGHAPEEILPQQENPLDASAIRITGSRKGLSIEIDNASILLQDEQRDDRLSIAIKAANPRKLTDPGYQGSYKLEVIEVVGGQPTGRSHPAFDQFFSSIEFHLAQGGRTENDCRRPSQSPVPRRPSPEINYLAKDYESFRQLILDRLSTVMPQWRDRSPADVGITLVEILAHIGDQLSYYQDAVATEAYLNTARRRISVRRHVRLVDYFMHEGCNARTLVCIKPERDLDPAPASQVGFATTPDVGRSIETQVIGHQVDANGKEFFEPLLEPVTPLRFTVDDLKDPSSLASALQGQMLERFRDMLLEKFELRGLPGPMLEIADQHKAEQAATDDVPEYILDQFLADLLASLTQKHLREDALQDLWLLLLRRAIILLAAQVADPPSRQDASLLQRLFREFVNTALRIRLRGATLKLLDQYRQDGPPSTALEQALVDELNAQLQSSFIRDVIMRPAAAPLQLPNASFPSAWLDSLSDQFANASDEQKQNAVRAIKKLGVHLPLLIFTERESKDLSIHMDQIDDREMVEWNYRLLEDAFPWQIARRRQLASGLRFYAAHNCMHFHTWGSRSFVLHAGSTTAALVDEPVVCPEHHHNPVVDALRDVDVLPDTLQPARALANLQPGDVLIFEEVIDPVTGNPSDADIAKRHAVRLTRVRFEYDRALADDNYPSGRPIVRIFWRSQDALPFDFCIAAVGPARLNCDLLCDVSVARGNVVLADHGQQVPRDDVNGANAIVLEQDDSKRLHEDLGHVPLMETGPECEAESTPSELAVRPCRFNPKLRERPLVFSEPLAANLPAVRFFAQDPRSALPSVDLRSIPPAPGGQGPLFNPDQLENPGNIAQKLLDDTLDIYDRTLLGRLPDVFSYLANGGLSEDELTKLLKTELPTLLRLWKPRRDLLASQDNDRHYVVEIDNDGFAHLRFGDNDLGRRPEAGEHFIASYRIADPANGNVGADKITDLYEQPVAWKNIEITVSNPLPALSGTPPESMKEVRQIAPYAIRGRIQRAIIPEDYARLVSEHFSDRIQGAIAERRWMGSWEEILITVDPLDRVEPDSEFLEEIRGFLYRYRRIGHDVVVAAPVYVPLRIAIDVFVKQGYQLDHVREDVRLALSNEILEDGRLGFFHPDSLSFGQGVFLSRLVEAAGQVTGVEYVEVTQFERYFDSDGSERDEGVIRLGPHEIARLDVDLGYAEQGVLQLCIYEASK